MSVAVNHSMEWIKGSSFYFEYNSLGESKIAFRSSKSSLDVVLAKVKRLRPAAAGMEVMRLCTIKRGTGG